MAHLEVAKRTLVDWNQNSQTELRVLKAVELEALQENLRFFAVFDRSVKWLLGNVADPLFVTTRPLPAQCSATTLLFLHSVGVNLRRIWSDAQKPG